MTFVYTAYTHTLVKGASVQLVFGFEVFNYNINTSNCYYNNNYDYYYL